MIVLLRRVSRVVVSTLRRVAESMLCQQEEVFHYGKRIVILCLRVAVILWQAIV